MEMARVICEVRPRYAFIENSPMLTYRGLDRVLCDLAAMGFDARWGIVGGHSANLVANGERLWVVAYAANSIRRKTSRIQTIKHDSQWPSRRQFDRAMCAFVSEEDHADRLRNRDELAGDMDRLKAIGNGQVPAVAALAWEVLSQ